MSRKFVQNKLKIKKSGIFLILFFCDGALMSIMNSQGIFKNEFKF